MLSSSSASPGSSSPSKPATPTATRTLSALALHEAAEVQRVDASGHAQAAERAQQLADIGFVPGEGVSVVARAWPGGDPLVVRVGQSRFALRKTEADCIVVRAA